MTKSTKHWYPRYCGDYGQKTKHLSLLEHGAYTLLLDYYYSTEKPIPANAVQVHRVCMAFAQEEQDAVQSVLDQFFELTENGYINKRVEEELEKRRDISEKRKKAAEARHNNNDANAVQVHSKCNANGYTSTSTSTSITNTTVKNYDNNNTTADGKQSWWTGEVIKLNKRDYESWFAMYDGTDEQFMDYLQSRDEWYQTKPPEFKKGWFVATGNHLARMAEQNTA